MASQGLCERPKGCADAPRPGGHGRTSSDGQPPQPAPIHPVLDDLELSVAEGVAGLGVVAEELVADEGPRAVGDGEVGAARRLADQLTARLPRFASRPHKDSRAPQNLYPIAGLERELRRRLGDPAFVERALRVAAHR